MNEGLCSLHLICFADLDEGFFVFLLLVFWGLVRMINKRQLSIDLFDFWKSGALTK
jgi:hypothetical protein